MMAEELPSRVHSFLGGCTRLLTPPVYSGIYAAIKRVQIGRNKAVASTTHELADFLRQIQTEMAQEYARIQKRALEDPGTAGDQGEENWATLLRGWLPPAFPIVTKGRILSEEGIASPQIDLLVLHPSYPTRLLDKKVYLAGGVAAAFECKITLKAYHIKKAMENAVEIRRLLPPRTGTPYRELCSTIVYGLLSHSHVWQDAKSTPWSNIDKHLEEADNLLVKHPREALDLLCVADLNTWGLHKYAYEPREDGTVYVGTSYNSDYYREPSTVGMLNGAMDQGPNYSPVGSFIQRLLLKLAWEFPSIRGIATYFNRVGLHAYAAGMVKSWPDTVYTYPVIHGLQRLDNNHQVRLDAWDEWSIWYH